MFALMPNAPSDADRLREIDVANESVHDHSAFISRFLSTQAHSALITFLHQLNAASTSLSLSQAAAFPHPPSIPSLLTLLSRIDSLIDTHPPLTSANTRFGNPAFRAFHASLTSHTHAWVQDMLQEGGMEVGDLPIIQSGRQRLMEDEEEGQDDASGATPHLHIPPHLPQRVVDSMRARGELPTEAEEQLHKAQHDHHPHTHPHPHPPAQPSHTEESKEEPPSSSQSKADPSSLPPSERLARVVDVLCLYLHASFGDARRIDYGTGHELNFLCFLYALTAIGFIRLPSPPPHLPTSPPTSSILSSLSLVVFPRYLTLMRRLQSRYLLEPAGSRGVWGLDDFSFLPFLLGSAQLIGHAHLRPRSIRYPEVVDSCAGEWMYVDAVRWVLSMKSVSFAEHSPMLNDITAVKAWTQVNAGLMKMYEAEVLHKYPIVQHFIFTSLLEARLVKQVTRQATAPVPQHPRACSVRARCVCACSLPLLCVCCAVCMQRWCCVSRTCAAATPSTSRRRWRRSSEAQGVTAQRVPFSYIQQPVASTRLHCISDRTVRICKW